MTDYKFFKKTLPDSEIKNLTLDELKILVEEAKQEQLRIEREIDDLDISGTKIMQSDDSPTAGIYPSEYSYLPALYEAQIKQDPSLRKKLATAEQLSAEVGLVLAVKASALVHLARGVELYERVNTIQNPPSDTPE